MAKRRGITIGLGLALSFLIAFPSTAPAQVDELHVLRDAEIEATLKFMARPIFVAANLRPEDVTIILVQSDEINAFVAGGMNLFLYSQLILTTDTPQQLIGVMAHETGHIAGGHLARRGEGEENASIAAILATVVGVAASVGAHGQGAGGAVLGGESIGMANLLAFSRTQEASADQAGISFMEKTGMSPEGLYGFLSKLMGTEALPESRDVQYTRTHPLTGDRLAAVEYAVQRWGKPDKPTSPELQSRYDIMKAKLMGYLAPAEALRKYGKNDQSFVGRYARAFALYRSGQMPASMAIIDQLIALQPANPYLYEFKGQMLFESGNVKDAVAPYRLAAKYAPDSGLIKSEAAHAIVERGDEKDNPEAIRLLNEAERDESRDPFIHRLLATVYGRMGNQAEVHLNLAEEAALNDDAGLARREARLAMGLTPMGSREWIAAQDIITSSRPLKKNGSIDTGAEHREDRGDSP